MTWKHKSKTSQAGVQKLPLLEVSLHFHYCSLDLQFPAATLPSECYHSYFPPLLLIQVRCWSQNPDRMATPRHLTLLNLYIFLSTTYVLIRRVVQQLCLCTSPNHTHPSLLSVSPRTSISRYTIKIALCSHVWWYMPVIIATWEAEAGRSQI